MKRANVKKYNYNFDEERITHKGENPDVKGLLDKISNDGIHIKVVNLKRHNFDDD